MKTTKLTLSLLAAVVLAACTSNDGSFEAAKQDYQNYEEITKQYQIDEAWWKGYQDPELNRVVEAALANNINLAKSAIAVNRALYQANLLGAELVPTFSASGKSSATKGAGSAQDNAISTSHSTVSHQAGINLSYTLDLWRRLADTASAAEWEYKATQEDQQAARLALINAVVNNYYQLAYLRDAISLTEKNLKNYEQMSAILANKSRVGLTDQLTSDQAIQATLAIKNTLLNLQSSQKVAEQSLRNLLNLKPNDPLAIRFPSLLSVKLQGVDLNVPVSTIANRPDVLASLKRLQGAFKTLTATEKSWFPTVTLGASLTGTAGKVENIADTQLLGGTVAFNLPFLNWYTVQNNIKLSEAGYEAAKLNYQQSITTALNEIDTYYRTYELAKSSFSNLEKKYAYDKKISGYYKNRYEQGVAEQREWLNARNTENSAALAVLESKYNLLKNENAIYQAMAGKYQR